MSILNSTRIRENFINFHRVRGTRWIFPFSLATASKNTEHLHALIIYLPNLRLLFLYLSSQQARNHQAKHSLALPLLPAPCYPLRYSCSCLTGLAFLSNSFIENISHIMLVSITFKGIRNKEGKYCSNFCRALIKWCFFCRSTYLHFKTFSQFFFASL